MTAVWNPSFWAPTLTIIDLLEKNKRFGGGKLESVNDAVRYITRTTGLNLWGSADTEALSNYIGRDGAAWVNGVNFHSKKFPARIKELELAAQAHPRASKSQFGLLVLSTGTTSLSKAEQIERLKKAGLLALKYLGVGGNRAFLAIHDDTKNLHLHIIYCRYDTAGRLVEREPGKFRRYLLEDLTARIAFELGYRLENGANTRPNDQGEAVDRVSNRVVRDAAFEPVLEGCKERNLKRQLLDTDHKIELVAMQAYWRSRDLPEFRRLLAKDGIAYINSGLKKIGGGAVFVDADGSRHAASDVNPRFRRGKIFNKAYKAGLPPEPPAIKMRREQQAAVLASAFTSQNGADAPTYAGVQSLTLKQQHEADRRLQRGFSDERPGAPRKVDLGEWPIGFPQGGLRAPTAAGKAFMEFGITPRDRLHHVELWRDGQLIALQRSDQIVVYSRKVDDMRALLEAAHKQWGTVELTGNSKFKARMADIAAELNIPISNPELALRIERRRALLEQHRDRKISAQARSEAHKSVVALGVTEGVDQAQGPDTNDPVRSNLDRDGPPGAGKQQSRKEDLPRREDHGTLPRRSKLDDNETPLATARPRLPVLTDATAAAAPPSSADTLMMTVIAQIDETRAPLVAMTRLGTRTVLLEPNSAEHFRLPENAQRRPELQVQLQLLYDRQEQEQNQLLDAIFSGQAKIDQTKHPYGGDITYRVTTWAEHLAQLWRLHQWSTRLQSKLEARWKLQEELAGQGNQARAAMPKPNDQHDAGIAALAPSDFAAVVEPVPHVSFDTARTPAHLMADEPVEQLLTKDEIRELLKPRRVGPDGVFHIVEDLVVGQNGDTATQLHNTAARPADIADAGDTVVPIVKQRSDLERVDFNKRESPSGPLRQPTYSSATAAVVHPTDEHDHLLARFETARSDEERRTSAAAIRADKVALARMAQRGNPQWVAIENQFRTQQRLAAMKGGGIAG